MAPVGQPERQRVQEPQVVRIGSSAGSSADVSKRAEEDPRAGACVRQQVGVLADPAHAGAGRQRALRERPVVDVGDVAGRQSLASEVVGQRLEPIPQGDVVVGAEGVAGDAPGGRRRRCPQHRRQRLSQGIRSRIPAGSVGARVRGGDDDDRSRRRIEGPRIGRQPRPVAAHPVHARHAPGGNARLHVLARLGEGPRVGHADELEPVTCRELGEALAHQPSRLRTTNGGGSPVGATLTGVSGMATRGIRKPNTDP